ncbi:toxin-antitoxin system YwqK family antitoxin [Pontibacter korlensis]|uniref:toxin-antitoxin system YwqK family antitoxin n=1 Tax=Pontibacter korlensis TaxID=400092 RepID=UPI000697B115|nr:toxin-antitoxin system YwqK family antitoxin [Pontibacter korlensis]
MSKKKGNSSGFIYLSVTRCSLVLIMLCFACTEKRSYVQREYYPSGQLKAETEVLDGAWHGKRVEYYPTGKTKIVGYYKHGKNHGSLSDYYENGSLQGEVNFKEGRLNGVSRCYYPNGKLEKMVPYKDGKRVGWGKFYREDGSLESMESKVVNIYEQNGKEEISQVLRFDERGKIIKDNSYYLSVSSNCDTLELGDTCQVTVTLETPVLKKDMQMLVGGYDEFYKLVDKSQQDTILGKDFKATYTFVASSRGRHMLRGRVDDFIDLVKSDTAFVRRERRSFFTKKLFVR